MLEGVFSDVSKKFGSKIDTNRIYYVGYSAGCRGVIRWAESNPAVGSEYNILSSDIDADTIPKETCRNNMCCRRSGEVA